MRQRLKILAGRKYTGVSFRKDRNKYRAYIRDEDGKSCHLGMYDSEEGAALAYDEAVREKYGPNARVNFPLKGERKLTPAADYFKSVCSGEHDLSVFGKVDCNGHTFCTLCSYISHRKYKHDNK